MSLARLSDDACPTKKVTSFGSAFPNIYGKLRLIAPLFALALPAHTLAQVPDDEAFDPHLPLEETSLHLERESGFLVDRTMTNFGATFVREFAHAWRSRRIDAPVDLTIIEKPSARWGSLIIIEHRNQPVARIFLQAGRSTTITPLAANAVNYLAKRLADNALIDKLFKNPDLALEELP